MPYPRIGTGLIITRDNKVLLLKRRGNHGSGTWGFLGGHLEFGENPEDCVTREALEEAGIKVKNLRHLTFTNDIHTQENKHYVTLFYTGEIASGEPTIMEPKNHVELVWATWDALPQPLFKPIENLLEQNMNPFEK